MSGSRVAAQKAARRGAAMLDRQDPGWWKRVKVTQLDLASGCDCVLGQVYGDVVKGEGPWGDPLVDGFNLATDLNEMMESYELVIRKPRRFERARAVFKAVRRSRAHDPLAHLGFEEGWTTDGRLHYSALTDAWLEIIAERKAAAKQ